MSVKITIAAKWTRDGNKMSTKMLYLKFKVGPILDNGKNGSRICVNWNLSYFPPNTKQNIGLFYMRNM